MFQLAASASYQCYRPAGIKGEYKVPHTPARQHPACFLHMVSGAQGHAGVVGSRNVMDMDWSSCREQLELDPDLGGLRLRLRLWFSVVLRSLGCICYVFTILI